MKTNVKFGACLPAFGNTADRYCLSGYGEKYTLGQLFERAASVKDIEGVELVGNWHVTEDNYKDVVAKLTDYGLKVPLITPDLWTQGKWKKGTFSSTDPKIRAEAVKEVKLSMDIAALTGANMVDVWLGQDGFDYWFSENYSESWKRIVDCVSECCEYRSDVVVAHEYKRKEPRTHLFVDSCAKVKCLMAQSGYGNQGILIDTGHSQAAGEGVAEAISFAGKDLCYIHINDNYTHWDDDMFFGSIHTVEAIEILYWLDKIGYEGWYTLDVFPYRENELEAVRESIAWVKGLRALIDYMGESRIEEVIASREATTMSKLIREAICSHK